MNMTKWLLFLAVGLTAATGCLQQNATQVTTVKEDEQAIRKWFDDWMTATKEGDLELARSLIADERFFLCPVRDR
jgi:hypothetical protein